MNYLLAPFAWLATHLVVMTLLLFTIAAGLLFAPDSDLAGITEQRPAAADVDVRPSPPPITAAASAVPDRGLGPATPDREERRDDGAEAAVEESARQAETEPPVTAAPSPRLIGGTLPVYQLPGHSGRDLSLNREAFRPPAAGQWTDFEAEDPRDRLVQDARRAFWNGEFEVAEGIYMTLIGQYPGDADAFGELGNLYQAMARPGRALDAYFEAGLRLKSIGDRDKLEVVRQYLEQQADARAKRLVP